jgi:hypothetical protein
MINPYVLNKFRSTPKNDFALEVLEQGRQKRGLAAREADQALEKTGEMRERIRETAAPTEQETVDPMQGMFDSVANSITSAIGGAMGLVDEVVSSTGELPVFSDAVLLEGFQNINLEGKTRSLPLAEEYMRTVSGIVNTLGEGWDVRVTSGGQAPAGTGGPRTGSTRHDVDETGHSHTADFVLTYNGKDVKPMENPEIYEQFFERAAPYFPGMGHYEGYIHVGGGSPAFWGPDTRSASANPRFAEAYRRGREQAPSVRTGGQELRTSDQLAQARRAIGTIESSNNYSARGEVIQSGRYAGERAMGRYQIMPGNLPEWSQKVLGRQVSVQEFMSNPRIQDQIFDGIFGDSMRRYGFEDAAAIWHSGRDLETARRANANDGYITTVDYVNKALREFM